MCALPNVSKNRTRGDNALVHGGIQTSTCMRIEKSAVRKEGIMGFMLTLDPSDVPQIESSGAGASDGNHRIRWKPGMRWLYLWTYVRLPLSVLICVLSAATEEPVEAALGLIWAGFLGFVAYGLATRKRWGWTLNWVVIYMEVLFYPLSRGPANLAGQDLIIGWTVVFLFWGLPDTV